MGSERTGPDLTNIGKRQPGVQWHLLHLYDPRMVQGSIMPRYPWLFEETATPAAQDAGGASARRAVGG
ncbi:MAG: cbb3-type cytochrome c oxidase subunit II [Flavobacteriales bacterium]